MSLKTHPSSDLFVGCADSPCVDYCVYDYEQDFCTGCGRSLEEISYWNYFTPQEKQKILKYSKKNLDSLSGSCYNSSTQGGSDGPD
jgi:predicted Fe-S protein YdhL (DUF1289 family)